MKPLGNRRKGVQCSEWMSELEVEGAVGVPSRKQRRPVRA